MLYVPGAQDIDANSHLDDPKVIKDIVYKCGLKAQYVSPPKTEEETDVCVIIAYHYATTY